MTSLVPLFALAQSPAAPPPPRDARAFAIDEAVREAARWERKDRTTTIHLLKER